MLHKHAGWGYDAVGVGRTILTSLISKIAKNLSRWKHDMECNEWVNILKLATVVEDFMFHRPIIASDNHGHNPQTGMPNLLRPGMSSGPEWKAPSRELKMGLHLEPVKGTCDDLPLAKRVQDLMNKLGAQDGGDDLMEGATKAEKDMKKKCSKAASAFRDFLTMFLTIDKGNESLDEVINRVSKFLVQRKRKNVSMGFFAPNPKRIAKEIKSSYVKQQAQRVIRTAKLSKVDSQRAACGIVGASPADVGSKHFSFAKSGQRGSLPKIPETEAEVSNPDTNATEGGSDVDGKKKEVETVTEKSKTQSDVDENQTKEDECPKPETELRHVYIPLGSRLNPSNPSTRIADLSTGEEDGGRPSLKRSNSDLMAMSSNDITVTCESCKDTLQSRDAIFAMNKWWHPQHFECSECKQAFLQGENISHGHSHYNSGTDAVLDAAAAAAAAAKVGREGAKQNAEAHLHPSQAIECPGCEYFEREDSAFCRHCYLGTFGRSVCAGCLKPLQRGQQVLSAMDFRFHTQCFNCAKCSETIEPTSNFFNCDDKPWCENCYVAEFKTCPGCKNIVQENETAVIALDRNWHADHFVCTECKNPFEDGEFYPHDANDGNGKQPYCEQHFNALFMPKCKGCNEVILEGGIEACGDSWHKDCFNCQECACEFPTGEFFEEKGLPYCEADYFRLFGQKCAGCQTYIEDDVLYALDQAWHKDHFTCTVCKDPFESLQYYADEDKKPYCEKHFLESFCQKCRKCDEYCVEEHVQALGHSWHKLCLQCQCCGITLDGDDQLFGGPEDNMPYCRICFGRLFGSKCAGCGDVIEDTFQEALGHKWHSNCFRCGACDTQLGAGIQFYQQDGTPYCRECFVEYHCEECAGCNQSILPEDLEQSTQVLGRFYHKGHLKCTHCERPLEPGMKICQKDDQPYCEEDFLDLFWDKCPGCNELVGYPPGSPVIKAIGKMWHPEHLVCFCCAKPFPDGKFFVRSQTMPSCSRCLVIPLQKLPEDARSKLDILDSGTRNKLAALRLSHSSNTPSNPMKSSS